MKKSFWVTTIIVCLLLCLGLGIVLTLPNSATLPSHPSDDKKVFTADNQESPTAVILYTANIQGAVDHPLNYASLAALKQKYQTTGADVLLLDAGNSLYGSSFANTDKGKSVIEVMNLCGYDAMAIGNYDLNYGLTQLLLLEKLADFPLLAANLISSNIGQPPFDSAVLVEAGNHTYGILALSTEEAQTQFAHEIDITDAYQTAEEQVQQLLAQGADYIIVLDHRNDDADLAHTLAETVSGIDIIIDGNDQSFSPAEKRVGNTWIAHIDEAFAHIGVICFFADGRISLSTIDADTWQEKDPEINRWLNDRIQTITSPSVTATIELPLTLDGEREHIYRGETNFGQLIADALLKHTEADIALLPANSICRSLTAGPITQDDLLTALTTNDRVVTIRIQGKQLLSLLEQAVSAYPQASALFPITAGLSAQIDSQAEAGKRIQQLQINGVTVDADQEYTMATYEYIANGGDYGIVAPQQQIYEPFSEIIWQYLSSVDFSLYTESIPRLSFQTATADELTI